MNSSGAVTDTYEYDAFGNEINHTGTTPNNYLYRGEQFDSDLGLYYLRARYYDPLTGRFMSRDPNAGNITIPATLHKYLYADGDPVDKFDPLGRDADEEYASLLQNETWQTRLELRATAFSGRSLTASRRWSARSTICSRRASRRRLTPGNLLPNCYKERAQRGATPRICYQMLQSLRVVLP
jgi:RHS repeat-associated protein